MWCWSRYDLFIARKTVLNEAMQRLQSLHSLVPPEHSFWDRSSDTPHVLFSRYLFSKGYENEWIFVYEWPCSVERTNWASAYKFLESVPRMGRVKNGRKQTFVNSDSRSRLQSLTGVEILNSYQEEIGVFGDDWTRTGLLSELWNPCSPYVLHVIDISSLH